MTEPCLKVTAFITRQNKGLCELLVFSHPHTGWQVPAGTVEAGEDVESAVLREVAEEAALTAVSMVQYLGAKTYDFPNSIHVPLTPLPLLRSPVANGELTGITVPNGHGVSVGEVIGRFTHITYTDPVDHTRIYTGWGESEILTNRLERHFFHLRYEGADTPRTWQTDSDGIIFTCFWTPLSPIPQEIHPNIRDNWLAPYHQNLAATC